MTERKVDAFSLGRIIDSGVPLHYLWQNVDLVHLSIPFISLVPSPPPVFVLLEASLLLLCIILTFAVRRTKAVGAGGAGNANLPSYYL